MVVCDKRQNWNDIFEIDFTRWQTEVRKAWFNAGFSDFDFFIGAHLVHKFKFLNTYTVTITYSISDKHKIGGKYVTATGSTRHIDIGNRMLIISDGMAVAIDDIYDLSLL